MASGSLARASLVHDWRRYFPGVLAVGFSGLLMLIQLGLLMGMFGTVTVLIDRSSADLWLTAPDTPSVDLSREIPASAVEQVRGLPEVTASEGLGLRDADWRGPDGLRIPVSLVAMRPGAGSLACPGVAGADWCAGLAEPFTVVVDHADLGKLGVKGVGEEARINGQHVRVIAISRGLRSIGSTLVFASEQTARRLGAGDEAGRTSFVLMKVAPDTDGAALRASVQDEFRPGAVRVWTAAEFSDATQHYWLTETGVGAGFVFASVLGIVIGVVVTSQTLRAAVLGNLREFATYRAMGVPASRLAGVILEQSLYIAGLGIALTLLVSALVVAMARAFEVPLLIGVQAVLAASLIGTATAVASGLYALRELYRLQPAELLR